MGRWIRVQYSVHHSIDCGDFDVCGFCLRSLIRRGLFLLGYFDRRKFVRHGRRTGHSCLSSLVTIEEERGEGGVMEKILSPPCSWELHANWRRAHLPGRRSNCFIFWLQVPPRSEDNCHSYVNSVCSSVSMGTPFRSPRVTSPVAMGTGYLGEYIYTKAEVVSKSIH